MVKKEKTQSLSAGDNSVVIGGSVQGSNIVFGNNNTITNSSTNIATLFDDIYKKLDVKKDLKPQEKEDLQAELMEVQKELEKSDPDETFLTRRFRNIKRMAPEIVEVAFETLKNPIGGVAEVIKRVAKKAAEEAGK